jgi:hypothetical protein
MKIKSPYEIRRVVGNDIDQLEAYVIFNRQVISQRLIFLIMEMTFKYGISCSNPKFSNASDTMCFKLSSPIYHSATLKRIQINFENCIREIKDFQKDLQRQLDFSKLDLTIFQGVDTSLFYAEHFSAVVNQYYSGDWNSYLNDMISQGRDMEAQFIEICMAVEQQCNVDIGLVGHALNEYLDQIGSTDKILN